MTDKNFEKRLKDKLHAYGEQPPPDMFSRIERTLVENGAVMSAPKAGKSGKLNRIYGTVAAAAVIAIAVVALLRMEPPEDKGPEFAKKLQETGVTEKIDVAELISESATGDRYSNNIVNTIIEVIKEDQGLSTPVRRIGILSDGTEMLGLETELDDNQALADNGAPKQRIPSAAEVRDEFSEAARRRQQMERERAIEDYWTDMFRESIITENNRRRKNKLGASLYAGNFGTGSGDMVFNDMNTLASNNMIIPNVSMSVPEADVYQGNRPQKSPLARNNEAEATLRHNMPVSAGISVAYPVSPKLSIVSGLNYTYLHSSATHTIDSDSEGKIVRKQHYIGLPLGVNYSVYSNRRIDLYVKAGGMIEKAVYVTQSKELSTEGAGDSVEERVKVKGFQPSIDAGVGANIRPTKGIGIYVEPGVAYYFERPNQLSSYRTENPTNFTVRVGVRFDIK